MTETLITARELATHLGVNEETIYRWVNHRKIPFYRLPSGQVRFPRAVDHGAAGWMGAEEGSA